MKISQIIFRYNKTTIAKCNKSMYCNYRRLSGSNALVRYYFSDIRKKKNSSK